MFKQWERDKWKHFYVGIPLGVVLQLTAMYFFPADLLLASMLSFAALVFICYAFELVSKITGRGHHELMDAIAGILGGLIGIGSIGVLMML